MPKTFFSPHFKSRPRNFGFTFIEVILTVGLLTLLVAIAIPSLQTSQQSSSVESTLQVLLTEMNQQQAKAMLGETVSGSTYSYGLYFTADQYILFKGSSYNASDPTNITVNLDSNLMFSTINLPSSQLAFNRLNGEVINFSSSQNTLILQSRYTDEQRTLTVNRYGVVSVN